MDFLRKHQVVILWGILAFFLVSIFIGFGNSFFVKGAASDAIATVDGEAITIQRFSNYFDRAMAQLKPGVTLDKDALKQKQQDVLRDLVQQVVFKKQSELYGIRVPDAQVVNSLTGIPQFHNDKGAFDPQLYGRFLQYQVRETPAEFESEQRDSIAFFKLRYMIQSCVKITDAEFAKAYAKDGAAFAKANAYDTSDPKKKHMRTPAEIKELFRHQLSEQKTMWSLNQWFMQIGQKLKVKPYLERLDAGAR